MVDYHYPDPNRRPFSMNEVCGTTLFDNFANANTFKGILAAFNQICADLQLDPLDYQNFYTKLKSRLNSWKAGKLWELLEQRATQKEYRKQRACQGLKVLIIGAGPCGLRLAIECALLGCKVVVLEKRDRFSRNNVLHFWPFVIHDLRSLGAKFFYPRFCAGSIDHISIRQLQCVLLKIALLLGVEIHENVGFTELVQPEYGENGQLFGWRANVVPADHYVSDYEFDVLLGADGKRNTVPGFRRKEFRGKLAIAITANFINRRTEAEERVQEISGVAFVFNQQFFKDLRSATGIDLENIVYYKDDTHYFVMTAKKQSLMRKGVIKRDSDDIGWLLSPENVDQEALLVYAREAADFATESALPRLDYALNHYGQPDIAMFDFTSLFSSEYSCRLVERVGTRLLIGVVGDSLHEPFWPTGSGCARGFLGVFDAAWMLRQYCGGSGEITVAEVLAERESAYRLLAQTTPENLSKSFNSYTIDPKSRYPRFEPSILPAQVRSLIDTDNPANIERPLPILCSSSERHRSGDTSRISANLRNSGGVGSRGEGCNNPSPYMRHQQLARWYQSLVAPYRVRVDNLTSSFRSGLALLAVLRRYRPDLMSAAGGDERFYADLKTSFTSNSNWQEIRSRAFNAVQQEFGLDPPLSVNDKEAMYDYLSRLKDVLMALTPQPAPAMTASMSRESPLRSISANDHDHENAHRPAAPPSIYGQETEEQRQERHKRRLQTMQIADELFAASGEGKKSPLNPNAPRHPRHRPANVEKLNTDRLKEVEKLISGKIKEHKPEVKSKKPAVKPHKMDQREVEEMEEKLQKTGMGVLLNHPIEPSLSSKESRVIAAKTQVLKERAKEGFKERNPEKYNDFDKNMKELDKWLHKPNLSGAVGVKELLGQHEQCIGYVAPPSVRKLSSTPPPVPAKITSPLSSSPYQPPVASTTSSMDADNSKQPQCHSCNQRVYLAEKLTVENLSFHRRCFRCAYCDAPLKLNGYGMERIEYDGYGKHFFCQQHLNLSLPEKVAKIKVNREKHEQQQIQQDRMRQQQRFQGLQPTRESTADFQPVTTPIEEKFETKSVDIVDTTPSKFDTLTKSRDLLSSGVSTTNTPERAEFEVTLRRRTTDRSRHSETDMNAPKGSTEEMEAQDEELDEEEMLRHNVGGDCISNSSCTNLNSMTAVNGTSDEHIDGADDGKRDFGGEMNRAASSQESDNDELSSDEERALTNLLDETGGALPSLDETVTLIQTLKTKKRAASRDNLDATDDDLIIRRDRTFEKTPGKHPENNEKNTTEYFTPSESMDETVFKTPACPGTREAARQRILVGLEKSRAEARARARLKSDEELCQATANRSGARYRSSSMREEGFNRAKSHEILSPRISDGRQGPHIETNNAEDSELLKRNTYSEDISTAKAPAIRSSSAPRSEDTGDHDSTIPESSPLSPQTEWKKPRAFLWKLLGPFSPTSVSVNISPATPSPAKPTIAASESNKETSLLSKIGWKYGPNKRRSRGSLSPQQSSEKQQDDVVVKRLSYSKRAPKATVDETELSDSSPERMEKPDLRFDGQRKRDQSSSVQRNLQPFAPSISTDSLLSVESNISDREVRRVQRAAAKIVKQAESKRHRLAGEVQRQMEELEVKRQSLNSFGLIVEKQLQNDPKNRALLERWFTTIEERDRLDRYEQELLMQIQELELEEQHHKLQQMFRDRISAQYALDIRSSRHLQEEQQLLEQMLHIVSQRDVLVSALEKHRAQDAMDDEPGAMIKKIEAILKDKRYDYRNFTAVFTATSNRSNGAGAVSPAVMPDERRYLSALDSVI